MKKFWCLSNPPTWEGRVKPTVWKLVAWDGTITGFLGLKVDAWGKPTQSNRTFKLNHFVHFTEKWTMQPLFGRRTMPTEVRDV